MIQGLPAPRSLACAAQNQIQACKPLARPKTAQDLRVRLRVRLRVPGVCTRSTGRSFGLPLFFVTGLLSSNLSLESFFSKFTPTN